MGIVFSFIVCSDFWTRCPSASAAPSGCNGQDEGDRTAHLDEVDRLAIPHPHEELDLRDGAWGYLHPPVCPCLDDIVHGGCGIQRQLSCAGRRIRVWPLAVLWSQEVFEVKIQHRRLSRLPRERLSRESQGKSLSCPSCVPGHISCGSVICTLDCGPRWWGRSTCPAAATLLYIGFVAGSGTTHTTGGGHNYQCLHSQGKK